MKKIDKRFIFFVIYCFFISSYFVLKSNNPIESFIMTAINLISVYFLMTLSEHENNKK